MQARRIEREHAAEEEKSASGAPDKVPAGIMSQAGKNSGGGGTVSFIELMLVITIP